MNKRTCIVCGNPISGARRGIRSRYCAPECWYIMNSIRKTSHRALLRLYAAPCYLSRSELHHLAGLGIPVIERADNGMWRLLAQARILIENIPPYIRKKNDCEPVESQTAE